MSSRVLRRLRDQQNQYHSNEKSIEKLKDESANENEDNSETQEQDEDPDDEERMEETTHSNKFMLLHDDDDDDNGDHDDDDDSDRIETATRTNMEDRRYTHPYTTQTMKNRSNKKKIKKQSPQLETAQEDLDDTLFLSAPSLLSTIHSSSASSVPLTLNISLSNILLHEIYLPAFDVDRTLQHMLLDDGGSMQRRRRGVGGDDNDREDDNNCDAEDEFREGGLTKRNQVPRNPNKPTWKGRSTSFLFGQPLEDEVVHPMNQQRVRSRNKNQMVRFGPPNYIGGGFTCTLVTQDEKQKEAETFRPPWPYSIHTHYSRNKNTSDTKDHNEPSPPIYKWFSFLRSETYQSMIREYHQYVAPTGDVNTLALFVADHPFCTEALMQLATVLFQTHQHYEHGRKLLRRILWIYECAIRPSCASLLPGSNDVAETMHLMDFQQESNQIFFLALFRLVQTSSMVGCFQTSFHVSRFLLSLDPYRDPMGILLLLDYFALVVQDESATDWILSLVESNLLFLYPTNEPNQHREEEKDSNGKTDGIYITSDTPKDVMMDESYLGYCCDLVQMPNWAYSYALALYRREVGEDDQRKKLRQQQKTGKASLALQHALQLFPFIPQMLLEKNKIDIRGRSFQRDWSKVLTAIQNLPTLPTPLNANQNTASNVQEDDSHQYNAAIHHIANIYVTRSYKIWNSDTVLQWLYDGCCSFVDTLQPSSPPNETHFVSLRNDYRSIQIHNKMAVVRYLRFDPGDYEDSFRTLPLDVNPLDPALLVPALVLDPNRQGRYLRIPHQQDRGRDDNENDNHEARPWEMQRWQGNMRRMRTTIDPDLPLVEIFWRSLMPWTEVEGVRPARH